MDVRISSGVVTGAGAVNHFVEQPNRGKRSMAVDTRTPDGLELLMMIIETADVFLTNLLPDSRARMGIDVEQVRETEDLAHWEKAFTGFGGVWDVVRTAHEIHADPQALANGYLPRATNPDGVEFALAASPVQFDETPLALDRAPQHGEHTDELLAELGFSEDEIIEFKINSVVL